MSMPYVMLMQRYDKRCEVRQAADRGSAVRQLMNYAYTTLQQATDVMDAADKSAQGIVTTVTHAMVVVTRTKS